MSDSTVRHRFRVWAALRRASQVLLRHSLKSLGLAVLITSVLSGAILVGGSLIAGMMIRASADPTPPPMWILSVAFLAILALSAICAGLLAAYAADCHQTGQKATFVGSWLALWRNLPMVLLIIVVQGLVIGLGTLLLVLPGVFVSLIVGLAIPARVSEGLGFVQAFRRSADITRFNRWRLLGYAMLAGIAVIVLAVLGGWVMAMVLDGMSNTASGESFSVALSVISGLVALLAVAAYWTFVAYLIGLAPAAAFAEFRAGQSASAVSDLFD